MNSTTDTSSGARLRALRLDRGLTVEDAAAAAGVGSASLKRLERGTTNPRPSTAAAVARFYGTTASAIWMPGVLPTRESRPMQFVFNPTEPYAAARAASGCADVGEITYRPQHGGYLSLGMRYTTWRLLVPESEWRLVHKVDRARGGNAASVSPEERDRVAAITRLTTSTMSNPGDDRASIQVPRSCEALFAEYFSALLERARSADTIEIAPAESYVDWQTEKTVVVPARTAPTAPIVEELEGFAQYVPWLDTARKAVA